MNPKIGYINFLNVLPLNYGYQNTAHDLQIVYGVPTFLNGELKAGFLPRLNLSEEASA